MRHVWACMNVDPRPQIRSSKHPGLLQVIFNYMCRNGARCKVSNTIRIYIYIGSIRIYDPGSRFATTPPPPHGMVPKPAFCSIPHENVVFAVVFACWRGPQTCKFVGFLQPTFRKRVICNVLASTSWSSAAAPSSISMSNCHIILNLLLRVYSLGTRLISVYILCLSNFLLERLVFRNRSNYLKFS